MCMQYPPGTGFVLALFPAGFQVIPLYVLANVTILRLCAACIAYRVARSGFARAGRSVRDLRRST